MTSDPWVKAGEDRALADREWWQSVLPTGWTLLGWTYRHYASAYEPGTERLVQIDGKLIADLAARVEAERERCAKILDKRADDYRAEHGSYDPSTGVTEYPGNGDEWMGEWQEIADEIRAGSQPSKGWECAAHRFSTTGSGEPQDCGYPTCGCDPNAERVITALVESGWVAPSESAAAIQAAVMADRDLTLRALDALPASDGVINLANEIRARPIDLGALADVVKAAREDGPQWDGTDAAHPAWWRGDDHGCAATVRIITAVLNGQPPGTYGNPDLTALCRQLADIAAAIREAAAIIRAAAKEQGE